MPSKFSRASIWASSEQFLIGQPLVLRRLPYSQLHDRDILERFGEKVVGTILDRFHRRLDGAIARHHQDFGLCFVKFQFS